jgi:hypothetical protein
VDCRDRKLALPPVRAGVSLPREMMPALKVLLPTRDSSFQRVGFHAFFILRVLLFFVRSASSPLRIDSFSKLQFSVCFEGEKMILLVVEWLANAPEVCLVLEAVQCAGLPRSQTSPHCFLAHPDFLEAVLGRLSALQFFFSLLLILSESCVPPMPIFHECFLLFSCSCTMSLRCLHCITSA